MTDMSGMEMVRRYLDRTVSPTSEAACHRIAVELRAEINGLQASMNGTVSARPGKRIQAYKETRIEGMKWALALALGLPPAGYQEAVNAFLEDFRQERLDAAAGRRTAPADN